MPDQLLLSVEIQGLSIPLLPAMDIAAHQLISITDHQVQAKGCDPFSSNDHFLSSHSNITLKVSKQKDAHKITSELRRVPEASASTR